MNSALFVLIVLALISVVAVLLVGVFSMMRGGEFNKKYGNKLMQARVILQGVALALIALAFFAAQK